MLPELQGSPKQITWALKIRTDKLNRWMKTAPEIFKEIETNLKKETKASFWIAHKDEELGEILKYIVGGTTKSKGPAASSLPSSSGDMKIYEPSDDGVFRYVGELRDATTGEVVVDPGCPF
jgi:hypothetical protein